MEKEEQQKAAVNDVFASIYQMLEEKLRDAQGTDEYVERLFLSNSRDFVRLLVNFNMVKFHP